MEDITVEKIEELIRDSERLHVIEKLASEYVPNLDVIIRSMIAEDTEDTEETTLPEP